MVDEVPKLDVKEEESQDPTVVNEKPVEVDPEKKKLLEKQKDFEITEKKLKPQQLEEELKEEKGNKIFQWIIMGLVFLGLIFLYFKLLA
jgi:hypothetical protein